MWKFLATLVLTEILLGVPPGVAQEPEDSEEGCLYQCAAEARFCYRECQYICGDPEETPGACDWCMDYCNEFYDRCVEKCRSHCPWWCWGCCDEPPTDVNDYTSCWPDWCPPANCPDCPPGSTAP